MADGYVDGNLLDLDDSSFGLECFPDLCRCIDINEFEGFLHTATRPEKNLLLATLVRAIFDYLKPPVEPGGHTGYKTKERIQQEISDNAAKWLFSESDEDEAFSAPWIAMHLGIADWIKQRDKIILSIASYHSAYSFLDKDWSPIEERAVCEELESA